MPPRPIALARDPGSRCASRFAKLESLSIGEPYFEAPSCPFRLFHLNRNSFYDIQAGFLNVASSASLVQAGKLRPLAVVNHTRLPEYPDIPTMQEVGFPDVGTIAWQGLFASAATPKPVLEALFQIVSNAMQRPDTIENLRKQNFNVVVSKSLTEAQTWLGDEMKHWESITNTVKIEAPN